MPERLDLAGLRLAVPAEPLTVAAFAPFGDVIENPRPDVQPGQYAAAFGSGPGSGAGADHPFRPVSANQGSAIKYQHVSRPADRYAAAPSRTPSAAVTNVFVCAARPLVDGRLFPVAILERHPYTTQTFVPLTAGGRSARPRYLVIVAPTAGAATAAEKEGVTAALPDLRGLRAFVARGDQAVTYGAGTWHAPMVALGAPGTSIAYAVFQFANGVGPEDCQEVVLEGNGAVTAEVPAEPASPVSPKL